MPPITTNEALARLKQGNARFRAGVQLKPNLSPAQRARLADGQAPFAAVLGCSDSRVPVETIFDQEPGDLFVVRVAGNVVAPTPLASLEFAVEKLGTRLIVVLGHTRCGAVEAALEAVETGVGLDGPLVSRIRPAIQPLLDPRSRPEEGVNLMAAAVRANVAASVAALKARSDMLRELAEAGELAVVGAEYALETGEIDIFMSA